ncbi:amino acid adenylation domain-containing protein [Streptomyces sp. NPDC051135]|uniref:non-ribosomal peptide synthetase n=1 Tax=unclassified Streptomyces TaxID=2593676 RepID=UPI003429A9A7
MTTGANGFETSWQQKETWLAGQEGHRVRTQALLRVDGPATAEEITAALEGVLARHGTLRTRFVRTGGRRYPLQIVGADATAPVRDRHDLTGRPAAEQDRVMERAAGTAREALPEPDALGAPRPVLFSLGGDRHALLITAHPLQADRASLVNLAAELAEALDAGGPVDEPALQYVQFSQWQQEVLDGVVEPMTTPADDPRESWPDTVAGEVDGRGTVRTGLTGEAARGLDAFAREHGVTVEAVLLAAQHVLLTREPGFGAPLLSVYRGGRGHEELNDAVGPYAFHAAMPYETDLGRPLAELAAGWQEELETADGSAAPPPHGGGHGAAGHFEYHEDPGPFRVGRVSVSVLRATAHDDRPGLRLIAERHDRADGPRFVFRWEHDRRLIADAYAARLAERYGALLTAAVREPAAAAGDLPRTGPQERDDLLVAYQGGAAPASSGPAHSLIEAQAARTPERVAVVEGRRSLTYAGLLREATRLAARLKRLGAGPGTRVGVRVGHTWELPVAILAVLRTGAAFVPIDPTHPGRRALDLLAQARSTVLLTSGDHTLPEFPGTHCVLGEQPDDATGSQAAADAEADDPGTGPDDLAYVMFTSGSTGRPKGVMVQHGALAHYLAWSADSYLSDGEGSSVVHSSIGFDLTITSLLTPLVAGRTVRLLADAPRDVLALSRALVEHEDISFVKLTPSHLRLLNGQSTRERMGDRPVTLVIGGEALVSEDLTPWQGARIVNEYGPTETVVGCTEAQWVPERHGTGAVPIGRPITGTSVHVLDGALCPVPVGSPGEVYIGGPAVAHGYFDEPARTAEAFVPDPFSDEPGGRLYRSRDIACRLPDGQLRYLGRDDAQIKIRGVRVEPEEARGVLLRHPGVRDAAVVARRTERDDSELVAFVVAAPGTAVRPAELQRFVTERAPGHLVPASFHPVDELPLNANGKTDTGALLARAESAAAGHPDGDDAPAAQPRDDIELRLLTLFEELLKRTDIGIGDDFFDLGGHSLLAVQLVAAMDNVFGTTVPLPMLFDEDTTDAATVTGLARALRSGTPGSGAGDRLLCLQRSGELTPLILVHPGGGEVLGYRDLARRLGPHRPVYAFQHSPADTGSGLHADVPDLAATYCETLLERFPAGPYLLAGWSFGGAVAHEMARRLRADGHPVGQVLLLDSYLRVPEPSSSQLLTGFAEEWGRILQGRIPVSEEFLGTCTPAEGISHIVSRAEAHGLIPAGHDNDYMRRRFELYRAHALALHRYRPSPAPGTVTLLQATDSDPRDREAALSAWRDVTDGVSRHIVAGDHFSMMRPPHVDGLSTLLRQALGDD